MTDDRERRMLARTCTKRAAELRAGAAKQEGNKAARSLRIAAELEGIADGLNKQLARGKSDDR